MGTTHSIFLLASLVLVGCTTTPNKETPQPVSTQASTEDTQTVMLDHKYFQILYSKKHRLPMWVEYTATKETIRGPGKRRDNFHSDEKLEKMGIAPVNKTDFPGYKFDRGHMAPAADFKQSQAATDETFAMSNMAPQTANLNRRAWQKLESRVRKWICGEGKVTVITGPILRDGLPQLARGITIPERFFKVVYDETPPIKAIAFIYSQQDTGDPYLKRIVSVGDVEKEIGLHLPKSSNYPDVKDVGSWKSCK
jgi:endonuclease G